jgi:hypothetical protein
VKNGGGFARPFALICSKGRNLRQKPRHSDRAAQGGLRMVRKPDCEDGSAKKTVCIVPSAR